MSQKQQVSADLVCFFFCLECLFCSYGWQQIEKSNQRPSVNGFSSWRTSKSNQYRAPNHKVDSTNVIFMDAKSIGFETRRQQKVLGMSLCITHHAKPTPVVSFCVPTPGTWIQYSETEVRAITLIGCSRISRGNGLWTSFNPATVNLVRTVIFLFYHQQPWCGPFVCLSATLIQWASTTLYRVHYLT